MRNLAAILLMFILLFSVGGYRMVISILQKKADLNLETRIDSRNYDESQLIEIRVALNMPYQERFTEFERHYGEIELDGKSYTYVQRKIEGDVLILKCIVNEGKEQLKLVNNDWVKTTSAVDIDSYGSGKSQQHHSPVTRNFSPEYDDTNFVGFTHSTSPSSKKLFPYSFLLIPKVILTTPHQPPEAMPA